MNHPVQQIIHAVLVESDESLSLHELSRISGADIELLETLVREGVLEAQGEEPGQWQFAGDMLSRARRAVRLSSDLELGVGGIAVVLDLLDEIASLKAQLRRALI